MDCHQHSVTNFSLIRERLHDAELSTRGFKPNPVILSEGVTRGSVLMSQSSLLEPHEDG